MSRLKNLVARLDQHGIARLGAALWFKVGQELSPADIDWAKPLLGEDGDRLLWETLTEASAISTDRILEPGPLARFLWEISAGENQLLVDCPSLVWTLPPQHPKSGMLGGTYLKAIIEIIELAQKSLLMTSPFLQEHGITSLIQALYQALARGVEVTVLTQEANNIASSQSLALEELRREAERLGGRLIAYSTGFQVGTTLHAKLVVADTKKMVLGSANITGPGLGQNVEAGVVLGEKEATEVRLVVEELILSGSVKMVFDTKREKD